MLDIRDIIEYGTLDLSEEVLNKLSIAEIGYAQDLVDSMLFAFSMDRPASSATYWEEKFLAEVGPNGFNRVLRVLGDAGYIRTSVMPKRNWAEIKIGHAVVEALTNDEITELRTATFMNKFKLRNSSVDTSGTRTKFDGEIKDTGLVRNGLAKSAETEFMIDIDMLDRYLFAISKTLVKGMQKMLDKNEKLVLADVNYMDISMALLLEYRNNPMAEYNLEGNINDSRGRAIKQVLKRVFNPINNKDCRALLVVPRGNRKAMTKAGNQARYRAIAELAGWKPTGIETISDKTAFGRNMYNSRELPHCNIFNENGRDDLHERIWIERIYADLEAFDLDNTYKAKTPIEKDATASMLQVIGALLGYSPFLEGTNAICTDNKLNDIWSHKHFSRKQFKYPMTRILYGSSKSCTKIWKDEDIEFTDKQVIQFNREINTGDMAIANQFKNFIIKNVEPSEIMEPVIGDQKFWIKCNKYKDVAEYLKLHEIYDTDIGETVTIQQSVMARMADLKSFKRYFVTLLVHNLDSYVADDVCDDIDWIIDIHDAFICIAEDEVEVQTIYSNALNEIFDNGEDILAKYFESIGIDMTNPKIAKQWAKIAKKRDLTELKCSLNALK